MKRSIIISWAFSIIIPFLLLMGSVRLLISPLFLEIEYRTPGFPVDTYGFNLEDRLYYSRIAADYLVNSSDITFLGALKHPDGSSLYNQRELSHMEDVKRLVKSMLLAWYIGMASVLLVAYWSLRKGYLSMFFKASANGGMLTIFFVISILFGVALSFNDLFTSFHQIFFQGDTWIFLYSDTLIRLFPMRFWRDAFIWIGIFTLAGAVICVLFGRKYSKKYVPPS